MAYDVTSWFVQQVISNNPAGIVRQFTIGSSDYSDRVISWPSFKKEWDNIKPTTLTLRLANEDKGLNFLRSDKTVLQANALIKFGFTHPDSGDEIITLYSGRTNVVKYYGGAVDIVLTDKFEQLGERVIGSSDDPISYSGSNYLPSDLTWYIVTSYGGYSAIESTSNPDINYEEFLAWAEVFSLSGVYFNAEFDGVKCLEALRKIGRYTLSAIYIQEDKISFRRFGIADSNVTSLGNSSIDDLVVEFSDKGTVNKQYTFADYSVESDYWQTTVFDVSTSSVNSYGLKESTEKDENIWYVGSTGALDLSQRIVQIKGEPFDQLTVKSYLHGFVRNIGETIYINDPFHGIDDSYRIMGMELDLDEGVSEFMLDRSQFGQEFILDTSTLGSSDVLT